jgi:protein gp37
MGVNMTAWNPWHGCHRYSEGCKHCYIHKGDAKRKVNTENIFRTDNFYAPIARTKKGEYKMKSGQFVNLGFSTDFFVEDADQWRIECWQMIKERQDLTFLFLTKRITRFMECIPSDWEEGYDNVIVGCTIENQANADKRLAVFQTLPIKHKLIICQPLLEEIDLERYIENIELVVVGGESDKYARPLDYSWVLYIREQCLRRNVSFEFRQCGTHFIKDAKHYTLQVKDLRSQARKADINWQAAKQ